MARDHQDRQRRIVGLQNIKQIEPVKPRPLQPDIKQNQARAPFGNGRKCCIAVGRRPRRIALIFENPGNEVANVAFVVHNKNIEGH